MPLAPGERRGVLYVIVCGAPPARDANRLVQLAQAEGWDVCVIATPSGRSFIDSPALEAATGHPVRSEYKQPDAADVLPPPDAIVVAPATFNTINKWAAGISDTLALGLLTEAIGKRLPVVALPFINAAQAEHPAFQVSVDRLRAAGVQLLYGPDVLELHEPGTGSQRVGLFPWQLTLEALDANQARRPFRRLDREARYLIVLAAVGVQRGLQQSVGRAGGGSASTGCWPASRCIAGSTFPASSRPPTTGRGGAPKRSAEAPDHLTRAPLLRTDETTSRIA